jgi:NitT/TauT family transport system permease protein
MSQMGRIIRNGRSPSAPAEPRWAGTRGLDRYLRWVRRLLPPAAVLVLVLGLWQAGVFHRLLGVQTYTLAYPSQILDVLVRRGGLLVARSQATMIEIVVGYVLGSGTGFLLAALFVASAAVRQAAFPVVNGLNSMPVVALAPLMVLYFGSDIGSKIAIITAMTVPPMAVNAYKGLTALDPDACDLLWTYAATGPDVFGKLRLPSSLPFVFTALKLNVTLSIVGAIIGEFFSARGGLGFLMSRALESFDMPTAWATITLAGLLGVLLYLAIGGIERAIVPWHASVRGDST